MDAALTTHVPVAEMTMAVGGGWGLKECIEMIIFRKTKYWLPTALFAGLFVVLFLMRTGFFVNKPVEPNVVHPSDPGEFKSKNAWMNIYQNRQKIGFSHSRYTKLNQGYQFSETVFMRLNTMGLIQDMNLTSSGTLHADFSLAEFTFGVSSGRFSFSAQGSISDTVLTLTTESSGSKQTISLNLNDKIYFTSGIVQAATSGDLKPGDRLTVDVFDPISMGREPIQLEILDLEKLPIGGLAIDTTKISMKYRGATQLAWIDESGEILKEQGMLGITREKTTREDALQGLSAQPGSDLTNVASIPSNMAIADPEALTRLVVEIDGIQDRTRTLHGGRQTFQPPVLTIEKENIQNYEERAHEDIPLSAHAVFLEPGPFVQSDHPAIKKLAADITADTRMVLEKVKKIVSWIQEHIDRRPVLSLPDALATLKNRAGDCNEHAVLFAALARASGIPTKIEAGLVYLNNRFYYHAWNAVFIGKWVTLDALFNQIPADVTHIRLTSGTQEDQMNILGLVGTIRIHVLDGTR
jgi:hypothetical protein